MMGFNESKSYIPLLSSGKIFSSLSQYVHILESFPKQRKHITCSRGTGWEWQYLAEGSSYPGNVGGAAENFFAICDMLPDYAVIMYDNMEGEPSNLGNRTGRSSSLATSIRSITEDMYSPRSMLAIRIWSCSWWSAR